MQLVRYIPMAKTNNTPLVRKTAPFYGQVVCIIQFVHQKTFYSGQVVFLNNLFGKTHLFLDIICLKVYSEACPEDKPVRDSSRAYFERMAGCLSGSMSRNQFREEPFETKTDVRSPIVKALNSKVMMTPRLSLTDYPRSSSMPAARAAGRRGG